MKRNKILIAAVILGLALPAVLWFATANRPDSGAGKAEPDRLAEVDPAMKPDSQGSGEPGHPTAAAPDSGLAAWVGRERPALPDSLQGTDVDGGVRANDQGELILEGRIRDLFEYYLSTLGEADLDDVKTWIAHHLRAQLPPDAAREAWALFRNYLDYRRKLDGVSEPGLDSGVEEMKSVMAQRNALRRESLGREAAEAFFAAEEAYDRYMIRRREIEQNDELDAAETRRRLDQARAELPQAMREVREGSTEAIRAREKVEQMRAEGASEAEVRAWREAELGPEAADRLEDLEDRRDAWQQRYQNYRRERAQLDTSGLAQQEREAAIRRLREAHFEDDELRRVQALDRMREPESEGRPDQ